MYNPFRFADTESKRCQKCSFKKTKSVENEYIDLVHSAGASDDHVNVGERPKMIIRKKAVDTVLFFRYKDGLSPEKLLVSGQKKSLTEVWD